MTLPQALNTILIGLSILVLLPIAVLCAECLAAALPRRRRWGGSCTATPAGDSATIARTVAPSVAPTDGPTEATGERPRAVVLIPAHNEQLVIQQTLASVAAALDAGDSVLVVADNCDDRTAELARDAGAEVVVRNDALRRGKGYALEFGLRAMQHDPPQVVVIVDADCLVEPLSIDILSRLAASTQRPVQGLNLTDRNPATHPLQVVSLLGNRFTNLIRPLGLLRLGLPCRLMGTGMAIPWPLAKNMPLAGDNLVEDTQLGIDLALQGNLPLFCPEARVTSGLPAGDRAFVSQRTRWEHGHLHTAVTQIPRLLAAGMWRRSWPLLAMALDLSVPPLTLLVASWTTGVILAGLAAWWLGASWLPMALLSGGGAALMAALGLGWAMFCRPQVPLRAVIAVPHYMLRKVPIYTGFLFRRQHSWIRTEREQAGVENSALPPAGERRG